MNGTESSGNICSKCGARFPAGAPEGLCPACLLAMNLAAPTELSDAYGPHGTRVERTPPLLPPRPEEIAHLFPQLEILEALGRGGMGVVYKARQKSLDRFVALKLLAPERARDPEFAARFQREAQALARLSHPNIVTIHDFGQAGDFYFLLMEYVDGLNLRQLLHAKKLSPEEALAIVPSLCDALQYAHERGIVHRDIKPENLLLDREGHAKIADFGIAKLIAGTAAPGTVAAAAEADVSAPPMVPEGGSPGLHSQSGAGTPGYMAPEQKSAPHQVDSRADIYSLGVVLYEMLTGERPTGPIEPPSSRMRGMKIDVRLDQVVLRALENQPELRWQSAADLRTQIQLLTGPGSVPSPAFKSPSPARHVLRGVWVGLLVLVTGMALALTTAFLSPEPRAGVMSMGAIVAFAAALVSGWIYAARSKRDAAKHGTNAPLFLTTAPHLGLALVIASLVIPLGLGSTVATAARLRLAAERRSQAERTVAAIQALAAAQKQIRDLAAQMQEAQRTLKQLQEVPVLDQNALSAAEERVKQIAATKESAEADQQAALRQKEKADVLFHSEGRLGTILYLLPILLFGLPGTTLGWRHLLAIRGLPRPRPGQGSGMIAALTWPLLILASVVGLIVLLPLNHGVWSTLGLALAMLAVLGTLGWSIARALQWLDGQPLFPSGPTASPGATPWAAKWFGILLLVLAVLVPLSWFAAIRNENSRELARWHMEMTRLQREWARATTDRFWAQTALDRHAIAAADVTTPQERAKAESERRKLTGALGRTEALVATLDTRMRALDETGVSRRSRSLGQQLAPILIGAMFAFCGLVLLRRAGAVHFGSKRAPLAWTALGVMLMIGVCVPFLMFSVDTVSDSGPRTNAPAQARQSSAPAASILPAVRDAPEGDLVGQAERRVLQAQYEKVLNELMNAESERDLLATRTGVSKEALDRESKELQEKIRVLTEQRDTLRRKIETLKP